MSDMVQIKRSALDEYDSLVSLLWEHRQLNQPKEPLSEVLRRIITERNNLIYVFKEHENEEWAQVALKNVNQNRILLDWGKS